MPPETNPRADGTAMADRLAAAEREVVRQRKVIDALVRRVERGIDSQGGGFSVFESAIALEDKVRARTQELADALGELRRSNESLAGSKELAEAASHTKQQLVDELELANRALQRERDEHARMESELMLAHKLEAVGQLAAGIAHEINTPIQFIGDSARFLERSTPAVFEALAICRAAVRTLATLPGHEAAAAEAERVLEESDIDYTLTEVPRAVDRITVGVSRVSVLVQAMKEFGHPGQREKTPADINHLLQTTLTVAHNEYKYVANIETEFGVLPPIPCVVSEVNQVFLNLLVNAAHAIADMTQGTDERGQITITTRFDEGCAVIEIADSGPGIPAEIATRVYEPFFTTKPPGKGTGQGLAIARSIVVDRHGGALSFTSRPGAGTTFTIRLPAEDRREPNEVAA
jgi:signal transduction histidine kinase